MLARIERQHFHVRAAVRERSRETRHGHTPSIDGRPRQTWREYEDSHPDRELADDTAFMPLLLGTVVFAAILLVAAGEGALVAGSSFPLALCSALHLAVLALDLFVLVILL